MRPGRQKTFSVSWLAGLGWSFGGYVTGTLLAAGAGALLAAVVTGPVLGGSGVLFFNLCHSYLQKNKSQNTAHPTRERPSFLHREA